MSKKVKFGPYMVKDGVVAKIRPWKKLRVPKMPEKLEEPYPDCIVFFDFGFEDTEQINALKEKKWQKEVIIRPYRQVRRQYICQRMTRPLKKVMKVAHQMQDMGRLFRSLSERSRNDG